MNKLFQIYATLFAICLCTSCIDEKSLYITPQKISYLYPYANEKSHSDAEITIELKMAMYPPRKSSKTEYASHRSNTTNRC